MKKIFCGLICLSMVLSLMVPVMAAEDEFELIYQNSATYEITIPASGYVDIKTGTGLIEFSVEDVALEENTSIAISLSSENYVGGNWHLVHGSDPDNKIPYTITLEPYEAHPYCEMNDFDACEESEEGNDAWLEPRGGELINNNDYIAVTSENMTYNLNIELSSTEKIGRFSDTLTFTSEILEHKLSGKWKFNETLTSGDSGGIEIPVTFSAKWHDNENNNDYDETFVSANIEITDGMNWFTITSDKDHQFLALYDCDFWDTRVIDYGNTPVSVPNIWYEWFIKNAVKIS